MKISKISEKFQENLFIKTASKIFCLWFVYLNCCVATSFSEIFCTCTASFENVIKTITVYYSPWVWSKMFILLMKILIISMATFLLQKSFTTAIGFAYSFPATYWSLYDQSLISLTKKIVHTVHLTMKKVTWIFSCWTC